MALRQWSLIVILGLALMVDTVSDTHSDQTKPLALLIAAPWKGEKAMPYDLIAMSDALRRRGFSSEEIFTLEGPLTRHALLDFLHSMHTRLATWPQGHVFLYVSGRGAFTGTTISTARVGLLLANRLPTEREYFVPWNEVFTALNVPDSVTLTLLPDT